MDSYPMGALFAPIPPIYKPMKKEYNILIQWPNGRYSLLWNRKKITLAEAEAALARAQEGWGAKKNHTLFICSPKRAERLLKLSREARSEVQI